MRTAFRLRFLALAITVLSFLALAPTANADFVLRVADGAGDGVVLDANTLLSQGNVGNTLASSPGELTVSTKLDGFTITLTSSISLSPGAGPSLAELHLTNVSVSFLGTVGSSLTLWTENTGFTNGDPISPLQVNATFSPNLSSMTATANAWADGTNSAPSLGLGAGNASVYGTAGTLAQSGTASDPSGAASISNISGVALAAVGAVPGTAVSPFGPSGVSFSSTGTTSGSASFPITSAPYAYALFSTVTLTTTAGTATASFDFDVTATPEPASLTLWALGIVVAGGSGFARRRRALRSA